MRWLITLFWFFIGGMLIWQFSDYNKNLDQEAAVHPQPGPVFFYPPNSPPPGGSSSAPGSPGQPGVPVDGPIVQQTRYWVEDQTPGPGNFTAHFIVKNVGNAKAVNVQIRIRPYSGIKTSEEDNGHGNPAQVLNDADPLAQFGQWVGVPDLEPGEESAPQSVVFSKQPNVALGTNPNAEITFAREKVTPQATLLPEPTPKHDN